MDDVCSLLLSHGQQSNSELLLLEGTVIADNPYDSALVHLRHPHTGDKALLQYKVNTL